jgi:HK97 family phage portal protein
MDFIRQIGQLLTRPIHSGYGGRGGGFFAGFGRNYEYAREAGPLWESCIPLMCLKWEQRNSIEAEIAVEKRDEAGDWQMNAGAPLLDLLYNPNPHFDAHQLLDALRFDYHIDGNAYLWKQRSGSGRVVGLWWIPKNQPGVSIAPRWEESGNSFIDCYEYNVNGQVYAIPTSDIIHFKNGINPRDGGRTGLSPFSAVLREVCTDNEAAVIASALCRNMGIPGVIISPKNETVEMSDTQRARFLEMWEDKFGGRNRGKPFVQGIPIEVTMPGFDLQQMAWEKLRKIPEERISGAFGIPAVVLGLGAGLEQSNAKASHTDAREQAYESCILPTLFSIARTLTRGLVDELGDIKNNRIWFDLSNVRVLQQDENLKARRMALLFGADIIKRSMALEALGYKPTPADDVYKSQLRKATGDGDAASDTQPTNQAEPARDVSTQDEPDDKNEGTENDAE